MKATKNITLNASQNYNLTTGNNMSTNVGNNVVIAIINKDTYDSGDYTETVRGNKKVVVTGDFKETTGSYSHNAIKGDALITSTGVSKVIGKQDAIVNKGYFEKEADETPKITEMYYTNEEGKKISKDSLKTDTTVFLEVKGQNLIGEIGDLELINAKNDFEHKGKYLKNDILSDYIFKSDNDKIELKVIKPKNDQL